MPKGEQRVRRQRPSADTTSALVRPAAEPNAAETVGANRTGLLLALACYLGWLLFLLLVALEVIR